MTSTCKGKESALEHHHDKTILSAILRTLQAEYYHPDYRHVLLTSDYVGGGHSRAGPKLDHDTHTFLRDEWRFQNLSLCSTPGHFM